MSRFAALVLIAASLSACDASFDARGTAPEVAFSVFGVLDSLDRPVRIRVEDVRATADKEADTPLTATLTDAATGVATTGQVRLEPDGAGGTARVADFGALVLRQGRAYRLALTTPDGRTAEATATLPTARSARVAAAVTDTTGRVREAVVFAGAGAPAGAPTIVYRIVVTPTAGALAGDTSEVAVPGGLRGEAVEGGYRVWVSPREDAPEILNRILLPSSQSARVRVLGVRVALAERSAEWAFAEERAGPHLTRARGVFVGVGHSALTFTPTAAALASGNLRR